MCADCDCQSHLLSTNVGDKDLRESGHLLLVGSCMNKRFPDIVEKIQNKNGKKVTLHVCLEDTHMNHVGFKIASIISYSKLSAVTVLTIDGSPHCVQLHYLIEDIKRHFTQGIETDHYVVEGGEIVRVSPEAVKRSRHLSKIESMIN